MTLRQILPSTAAEEAFSVFGKLVEARIPKVINDEYFGRNWSPLWDELAAAGWTSFADNDADERGSEFSLLDLSAFAEMWGGFVIPLPLIPTVVSRRWASDVPFPSARLSYGLIEHGRSVVAYGDAVDQVLSGNVLIPCAEFGSIIEMDCFAASLPIGIFENRAQVNNCQCLQEAAILAASEAIGSAARLLQVTVEYTKTRTQFGRPVGSFQAIKHLLANLHVRLELSRSAIVWACIEPGATEDATRAVLEHCLRVAEGCVQAHGGVGYTWAAVPHRYYRHIMSARRVVAATWR